jgi:tetratricopeptide (TPR) repeat protein
MSECPSPDTLRLFLREQLEPTQHADVEAHVNAGCERCDTLVRQLLDPLLPLAATATACAVAEGALPQVPGYELRERLGQGGMGEVFFALDCRLNREVAVKVLRSRHAGEPELERRFLEEAQIASQLPHPGVAPVHEVGTLPQPDGRPYFVMKLVRGRTLAALLAERTSVAAELPRFLAIFEQVCQTVAFAHSRGVLHRDLKPANVMVDSYGEVQLMDWGLAKVIGAAAVEEPSDAGLSTIHAVRTDRSGPEGQGSQAGSVLGTPAYMAPEQARGAVSQLDRRTDVFGLGAVLCEILTGQPPYVAERGEVLPRAAEADQEDALARLDHCGADAALVALARSCLSPAREARPRDGGAVAARLAAYREGVQERLRQSELEKAAAQTRAVEAKKRQRLTIALAVAVVLGLGTAGAGAWYLHQQQLERQAERDRIEVARLAEVNAALDDAERRQAEEPPERAWAALDRAETRLGDNAPATLRRRAEQVRAELERRQKDRQMLARLDEARLQKAATTSGGYFDSLGADRLYQEAFRWYGLDVERLEPREAAARVRASTLASELLDALDDWCRSVHSLDGKRLQHLRAVADGADPDNWRRQLRLALGAPDRAAIQRVARETPSNRLSPAAVVLLADALKVTGEQRQGLEVLREAQRRQPGDFWLAYELAYACSRSGPGDREEAVRYRTAALALRPDSPAAHDDLGVALGNQGKWAEAEVEHREALRLKSDYPKAHNNLGVDLLFQGKGSEAEAEFRTALRLRPDYPEAHTNLGNALHAQGKLPEAEAQFREALRLQPDYSDTHYNLGNALQDQGRMAEAVASYQEALRLQPDLPKTHHNLGCALHLQGKWAEAVAEFQEALRLKPDYPGAHNGLGNALQAQGKWAEAVGEFREVVRIQPNSPHAHNNLGAALVAQGKLPEAVAAYREALRLRPDYPEAHTNLGNALLNLNKSLEAITEYQAALRLQPDFPDTHYNLGNALQDQGRMAEAVASYQEALRLQPDFPKTHHNLGCALHLQGKWAEAVAEFQEALRLKPDYPGAHIGLGNALQAQGKWAEAVGEFREVVRLQPNSPDAHNNLGAALVAQGKLPEAEAAYREALRLDPDYPETHYNLGNALKDQGKPPEAVAAYREALRLKPDYPEAHTNLGLALQAQGKLPEAIAEYREALRLNPDLAEAHIGLGNALKTQGKLAEAMAEYREALRLAPNLPRAHLSLGIALFVQRKWSEAEAEFRSALRLKPGYVEAHYNLGLALQAQGRLPEAEASFRAALHLRPAYPAAHNYLAITLADQGKLPEAIAEYREALRLRPDHAETHFNLGRALAAQGKLPEAVAEFREAQRLQPDHPEPCCKLGEVLTRLGQFQPALDAYRRGHELGQKQPGWRYPSDRWVREAERLVELDAQLPALLHGDRQPKDAAEQIELAGLCEKKRLPAAAVRFYAGAFAASPKLADDLDRQPRYDAACCASLAGSGHGADDPKPDSRERARLRGQARAWLAADLRALTALLERKNPQITTAVGQRLRNWQQDADLSGMRHPWALWRLPADERQAWRQFWADVADLRKKAQAKD